MLDICESFAVNYYDMKFTCVKSVAVQIGSRYYSIMIWCNKPLAYVSSVKYLAVCISPGSTL